MRKLFKTRRKEKFHSGRERRGGWNEALGEIIGKSFDNQRKTRKKCKKEIGNKSCYRAMKTFDRAPFSRSFLPNKSPDPPAPPTTPRTLNFRCHRGFGTVCKSPTRGHHEKEETEKNPVKLALLLSKTRVLSNLVVSIIFVSPFSLDSRHACDKYIIFSPEFRTVYLL